MQLTSYIILLYSIFHLNIAFTQLSINVGGDIHSCQQGSNVELGEFLTINGGIPPYTYTWHFNEIITGLPSTPSITSSMYIDDTTSANPTIYIGSFLPPELLIYLKVEDDVGDVAFDTLQLSYSYFVSHLSYETIYLAKGDSVFLQSEPNVDCASIWDCEYLWQPGYGLSDSTKKIGFWAKPEHDVNYTLQVTDSKGCTEIAGGPMYKILVHTSNISDALNLPKKIKMFPNPVKSHIYFLNTAELYYEIHSNSGEVSMRGRLNEIDYLDLRNLSNGIYFIKFFKEKKVNSEEYVQIKKIIKL